MTPARLREIVAAARADTSTHGDVEMRDALVALADLAGIDRKDADLDEIEVRANTATSGRYACCSVCSPSTCADCGSCVCYRLAGNAELVARIADLLSRLADVSTLVALVRRERARIARAEDTIADMREQLRRTAPSDE